MPVIRGPWGSLSRFDSAFNEAQCSTDLKWLYSTFSHMELLKRLEQLELSSDRSDVEL
jgi:hypothetical protein